MINPCTLRTNASAADYLARLQGTRLGKLLTGNKPFIVVANDEPYFLRVYSMIRETEREKGTWTPECEDAYNAEWTKRIGQQA
jgi:hypothetical protein